MLDTLATIICSCFYVSVALGSQTTQPSATRIAVLSTLALGVLENNHRELAFLNFTSK